MHGRGHGFRACPGGSDHLLDFRQQRVEAEGLGQVAMCAVAGGMWLGMGQQPGIGRDDEDRDTGGIGIGCRRGAVAQMLRRECEGEAPLPFPTSRKEDRHDRPQQYG